MALLTKYECARVMGLRYLQLQQETSSTEVVEGNLRAHVIREMLQGTSSFIVRRTMPDGQHQDIPLCEMVVPDDLREHLEYLLSVNK